MDHRSTRVQALCCVLLAVACVCSCMSGGATDSGTNGAGADSLNPQISLSAAAPTGGFFVTEGGSVKFGVTLVRQNGYAGAVPLSVLNLPTGVTGDFNPPTLTGATLTSTLTLSAANTAVVGEYGLGISATGSNGNPVGVPVLLSVVQPRVSVSKSGTGGGTITSSPGGINCGGTCAAGFPPGTSVTLTAAPASGSTFAGWGGGGACSGTTATCVVTTSATQVNVAATFNSTAQGFTMALSSNSVSVQQGGTASATVTLTRDNGFAGAVNLVASGEPAGLTITLTPSSITGTTSTLNLSAAATAAAGSYPLTITATATGVPTQTATLAVQVTPASGGNGVVALSFATCDPSAVPIWFAVQSGNGAWTPVTPGGGASNTFTFTPGAAGGIAYVTPSGTGFATTVVYASASEMTAIATGPGPCGTNTQIGTKHLTGQVANNGSALPTTVSIGGAETTFVGASGPNYALNGVPAGIQDFVAAYSVLAADNTTGNVQLIVRHNVNYANNSVIPTADFGGPEGFQAVQIHDPLQSLGTDQSVANTSLLTANGSSAAFYSGVGGLIGGLPTMKIFAVPNAALQPSDFQVTLFGAVPQGGNSPAFRYVLSMQHSPVVQTITFGPALSTPTITSLGSSPYLRLRAQWASQSAYNGVARTHFEQSANSVDITTTAAYAGAVPSNWVVDVPDLTSAGYNVAWGLHSGSALDWSVSAIGGTFLPFAGGTPVDGAMAMGAEVSSGGGVTFSRVSGWMRTDLAREARRKK